MQRRAAAVSVAFFLVVSAGAYAFIGTAQEPTISLEDPDYSLQTNQQLTVGGTTYTVTNVGDGSATAEWTNESARYTATLENGSVVEYEGTNYTVVPNKGADPTRFRLVETQTIDKPTTTQDGTEYVIIEDGDNRTLVPVDEYLPEPEQLVFAEGDDFPHDNRTTTVADVTSEGVTLEWFAPKTNEVSFSEGSVTTLGGTDYMAHIEPGGAGPTLELTTDMADYQEDIDAQNYYQERVAGLWGVSIVSALAAIFLLMLSFLPPRY